MTTPANPTDAPSPSPAALLARNRRTLEHPERLWLEI